MSFFPSRSHKIAPFSEIFLPVHTLQENAFQIHKMASRMECPSSKRLGARFCFSHKTMSLRLARSLLMRSGSRLHVIITNLAVH